jgi:hypothetical protein
MPFAASTISTLAAYALSSVAISSPLGSTFPSAIVMSMVIVDGVAGSGFAADPSPVGDAVPSAEDQA